MARATRFRQPNQGRRSASDTETNPPTGARKFRALVQRHKADFVLGSVHSGIDLATAPIAKELKTVYIPNGMAAEMTGKKGNRYPFRVGSDTYSQAAAGSGLLATVAASSTSIMGCCGSGVAGGVLTLAGVGPGTASEIAGWSTPVQALFIVGFVLNWLRLRGKLGVVGGR